MTGRERHWFAKTKEQPSNTIEQMLQYLMTDSINLGERERF